MAHIAARRTLIAAVVALIALCVFPVEAGLGVFSSSFGGATCGGYGATGAPAGYAYSSTDADWSSGTPLSSCFRGIPEAKYCDDWGCYFRYAGYATTYMYDYGAGAYSSHAMHLLGVPVGQSWYAQWVCTRSWTGGTSACP